MACLKCSAYDPERVKVVPKDAVVLDPEDYEQIRGLVQLSSYLEPGAMVRPLTEALQRGLRSLVKPPRIPEPGVWGVVEATVEFFDGSKVRRRFVRHDTGLMGVYGNGPWHSRDARWAKWDDLADPVLVRPGLDD